MHEAGIFSYERVENVGQTVNKASKKAKCKRLGSISVRSISISAIAFMMGRVSLIGGFSPFGMAFFAAAYGRGVSAVTIGTSIVIGALTWSWSLGIGLRFIAVLTLFGIFTVLANWTKVRGEFINCLKVFASVFLISIFPLFFKFLLYDLILSLFEAVVTVMLYILFKKGTAFLLADEKKNILTGEEVISLIFIGVLTIAGIRDIGILGMDLRSIVCIFIVLVLSKARGAGIGAAAGVIMGLVSGLTGMTSINVIGAYAFSGLLAGLFRKLGNIGIILGFITGNAVLTYYLTGSTEILIQLRDIIIASGLFYLMPKKVVDKAEKIFKDKTVYVENLQNTQLKSANTAVHKLNEFSKAVEELAVTFTDMPQREEKPDEYEIAKFFDTIVERVCRECSLCRYCWDREFNNTYQSMFSMLEMLEQKGVLTIEDVPDCFSDDSCVCPKELIDTMNNLYEVYRVNLMWRKKIGESRELVSQQLRGVSSIISRMANEIDSEANLRENMEFKITNELEKHGFDIDTVIIENDEKNQLHIAIKIKQCPGIKKCRNEMEKILSDVIGKRMVREGFLCNPGKEKSKCITRFTNNEMYGVSIGVSRISRRGNTVSGDSYTFMESRDKKYILGLSDGMGTGESAANNSRIAIDLLEKFMQLGFDRDTAISIINSVLVLKTAEESYATMDISAIDLFSGQVEFVKIGSPPAYIKKKNKVEIIRGASMPAGILENVDMELYGGKVTAGDFVIMVTDGVTESNWKNPDCGDWIANFLDEIETGNPQELADLITQKAIENYGEKLNDDLMVLVAKVWERTKC